jgi:hypothetical protein
MVTARVTTVFIIVPLLFLLFDLIGMITNSA